ncbi:MAG TPA: helix-turn-helix domain-containing protein [Nocardioidaceae bacterium]|nr:helix-turn-helix domain-containing protein [Nocardioidaceae bacterium]
MTTATRVPQAERTRAMRQRLMEATVACLVERGWAGTSTAMVAQRAEVSRGAMLHHFPTKADLVVGAVEHLSRLRRAELLTAAEAMPSTGRTRHALGLLADHMTGAVFQAALELWVAARTYADLRATVGPLEQRVGRETHRVAVRMLGVDESEPGVRELVQATLDLVRGLALADTLTNDRRRREHVLDAWADVLDRELERTP